MDQNKIRFATIGTSRITEKFLNEAVKNSSFQLAAVYSRSRKKAEEFAKKHHADRCYDNLDDMARDQTIDAVYIASPNAMHYAQAVQFIAAGKHILCEKALCSNSHEAEQMFDLAEKNQVVLLEAVRSLHDPGFAMIKDCLDKNKIGKIRRASFRYCQYSSRYDDFKAGIVQNIFDPKCSAGALMDIGVYCVQPMAALFGEPESLHPVSVMLEGGIDGAGTVTADYGDMIGELVYSKITESHLSSEIQGESGVILIDSIASPSKIEIRYYNGKTEKSESKAGESNLKYELQTFIEAVRGQINTEQYREISLQSMRMMDQIRKICGIRFPADNF